MKAADLLSEEKIEEKYEPMFGVGMFDEPIPDTTGIIAID